MSFQFVLVTITLVGGVLLIVFLATSTSTTTTTTLNSNSSSRNLKVQRNVVEVLPTYLYKGDSTVTSSSSYSSVTVVEYNKSTNPSSLLFDSNYSYQPINEGYRMIHYYDSNPEHCSDCVYFKEHYIKLAKRMHEILNVHNSHIKINNQKNSQNLEQTSIPSPLIDIQFFAVSCPHNPELCLEQKLDNSYPLRYPMVRLYHPARTPKDEAVTTKMSINVVGEVDGTKTVTDTSKITELDYNSLNPKFVLDRLGIETDIHKFDSDWEDYWNIKLSIEQKRQQQQQKKQKRSKGINITKLPVYQTIKTSQELENDVNLVIDNMLRSHIHQSTNHLHQWKHHPQLKSQGEGHDANNQYFYPISDTSQEVLKDFLMLLDKTLPHSWSIHVLLQEILRNLRYVTSSRDYLVALLDEYHTSGKFVIHPNQKWSAQCLEYNSKLLLATNDDDLINTVGEFTCGFWELLNTISVGLVEYNIKIISQEQEIQHLPEHHQQPPKQLLEVKSSMATIRDFLKLFNGGGLDPMSQSKLLYLYETCGYDACHRLGNQENRNFGVLDARNANNNSSPTSKRNEWIQWPLWLVEVQNSIHVQMIQTMNNRHNDRSGIGSSSKSSFVLDEVEIIRPSVKVCSSCWHVASLDGFALSGGSDLTVQNNDMMYNYLKLQYGPQNDQELSSARQALHNTVHQSPTTQRLLQQQSQDEYDQLHTGKTPYHPPPPIRDSTIISGTTVTDVADDDNVNSYDTATTTATNSNSNRSNKEEEEIPIRLGMQFHSGASLAVVAFVGIMFRTVSSHKKQQQQQQPNTWRTLRRRRNRARILLGSKNNNSDDDDCDVCIHAKFD